MSPDARRRDPIQEVHGDGSPNSRVFLSIGGTVVVRRLNPGEEMIVETRARIKLRATPSTRRLLDGAQVDTNTVVGFENTVGFDVRNVGSFLNCCLGGEGCFNTVFTGPGNVYLQSISVDKGQARLRHSFREFLFRGGRRARTTGGERHGRGSRLGPVALDPTS